MNQEIEFSNGNKAQSVKANPGDSARLVLSRLGLAEPRAVLVLAGGDQEEGSTAWDESQVAGLQHTLSRGFVEAAGSVRALVLDMPAAGKLARMVGDGAAHRLNKPDLLGVVPAARAVWPGASPDTDPDDAVPLDPNHGHYVMVEGDAAEMLDALSRDLGRDKVSVEASDAEPMADEPRSGTRAIGAPVVLVVINGGAVAKDLVLRQVRRKKPVILIEGSGGLADALAGLVKSGQEVEDPVLTEILLDGNLRVHALKDSPEKLVGLINRLLGDHPTIELAWRQFALFDANAVRLQRLFHRLQKTILLLGVLSTLFALTQTQIFQGREGEVGALSWLNETLHFLVVVSPILISILISAANAFKAGQNFVTLRAAAEGIKREVYLFRARAGGYGTGTDGPVTPPRVLLAERIRGIAAQVMDSSVRESALRPYNGSLPPPYGAADGDDGMSFLSPARYIAVRLTDQLNYYQSKTTRLEKQLSRLQWAIYLFGGLGTLLAAMGLDLWIALTTSIVAAITTFLEYQQIAETLRKYNMAANDLGQILNWWNALSASARADPGKIDLLVVNTESTLASESANWVQRVTQAITELQNMQRDKATPDGNSGESAGSA